MFTGIEVIPQAELEARRARLRRLMAERHPGLDGLMVFSRTNIYYLTGTFAIGLLWFPMEGEPVLAVRKGVERAALEAPGTGRVAYNSYGQIPDLMNEMGSPVTRSFGVEENGLSWGLGKNFSRYFTGYEFGPADDALARARSVKTAWELAKVRTAGKSHYECMARVFPRRLRYGMSGFEAARVLWDIFAERGNTAATRISEPGQEMLLGHVSVNENSAYPSYYNGPLGVKGKHPTAPFMGHDGEIWSKGGFMAVDAGFVHEGYNSDKTLVYFAGKKSEIPGWARRAQDCCLEIQQRLAEGLKPGNIPSELYRQSLDMAAKAGYAEGYMGHAGNQVPFMGHSLGLQVDEWPVLANKFDEPLEEDMVIALEPKITVPGKGMIGVENTFIVKAAGGEAVCAGAPDLSVEPGDFACIEE